MIICKLKGWWKIIQVTRYYRDIPHITCEHCKTFENTWIGNCFNAWVFDVLKEKFNELHSHDSPLKHNKNDLLLKRIQSWWWKIDCFQQSETKKHGQNEMNHWQQLQKPKKGMVCVSGDILVTNCVLWVPSATPDINFRHLPN